MHLSVACLNLVAIVPNGKCGFEAAADSRLKSQCLSAWFRHEYQRKEPLCLESNGTVNPAHRRRVFFSVLRRVRCMSSGLDRSAGELEHRSGTKHRWLKTSGCFCALAASYRLIQLRSFRPLGLPVYLARFPSARLTHLLPRVRQFLAAVYLAQLPLARSLTAYRRAFVGRKQNAAPFEVLGVLFWRHPHSR